MNASTLREIGSGHRYRPAGETAADVAAAASVLATATRSWSSLPPTSIAEVDAIGNQLEGCRRALRDLRLAIAAEPSPVAA